MNTTQKTVAQDNHAAFVIAVEDYEGVPVLLHQVGHYPSLVDSDGKRITRLVDVQAGGGAWIVTGQAGWGHGGRMEQLTVGQATSLEEARKFYPAALQAITDAPRLFAEARDLAKEICNQGPLSREQYEALAVKYKFPALPDDQLSSWGDFSFPASSLADLPRIWAGQFRAFAIERSEQEAKARRAAEHAAVNEANVARLSTMPVLHIQTVLVPAGQTTPCWVRDGKLHTPIKSVPHRITDDDPSIHGSHLLGHEGEMGALLTIEGRGPSGEAA